MKITRDVVLDLMPLVQANEASADTRALVEEYLKTDPALAEITEGAQMELPNDIPVALTQEDRMKAYLQTKQLMLLRTVILAAIISGSVITLLLVGLAGRAFLGSG